MDTDNVTPTVCCSVCLHPIDVHAAEMPGPRKDGCRVPGCDCECTPNMIAVALVHSALYGGLTQPDGSSIVRPTQGQN